MFASVLNRLFQCAHKHLTRPIAPVRIRGAPQGDSYVVCLDCGKRFAYDPTLWKIGAPLPADLDPALPGSGRNSL